MGLPGEPLALHGASCGASGPGPNLSVLGLPHLNGEAPRVSVKQGGAWHAGSLGTLLLLGAPTKNPGALDRPREEGAFGLRE